MRDFAALALVAAFVAVGASFFIFNPQFSDRAMSVGVFLSLVAIFLQVRWYTHWREKEYARRITQQEKGVTVTEQRSKSRAPLYLLVVMTVVLIMGVAYVADQNRRMTEYFAPAVDAGLATLRADIQITSNP